MNLTQGTQIKRIETPFNKMNKLNSQMIQRDSKLSFGTWSGSEVQTDLTSPKFRDSTKHTNISSFMIDSSKKLTTIGKICPRGARTSKKIPSFGPKKPYFHMCKLSNYHSKLSEHQELEPICPQDLKNSEIEEEEKKVLFEELVPSTHSSLLEEDQVRPIFRYCGIKRAKTDQKALKNDDLVSIDSRSLASSQTSGSSSISDSSRSSETVTDSENESLADSSEGSSSIIFSEKSIKNFGFDKLQDCKVTTLKRHKKMATLGAM